MRRKLRLIHVCVKTRDTHDTVVVVRHLTSISDKAISSHWLLMGPDRLQASMQLQHQHQQLHLSSSLDPTRCHRSSTTEWLSASPTRHWVTLYSAETKV